MSAPSAKHEYVPRERLLLQLRLHQRAQAREAAPQVRHSRRDPDPRVGRQRHHVRRHPLPRFESSFHLPPQPRTPQVTVLVLYLLTLPPNPPPVTVPKLYREPSLLTSFSQKYFASYRSANPP